MHEFQTTVKSFVELSGIGVHSGRAATIRLGPADVDSGIVFHIVAKDGTARQLPAIHSMVGATALCTVLGESAGHQVATVEHIMATLFGLGIDNVAIEIEGGEVPIMDGSAAAFVEAIDEVGIETLEAKRRYIRVLKPVRVDSGGSWAEFTPHRGTRFEVEIDFQCAAIGRQAYAVEMTSAAFRRDVARARTFGFMSDVEKLWASGYALGSSLENSIVIGDDDRVINMEGLRFPEEFVRHKTLDALGDLALAGARFVGCFRSYKGGHRLNAAALSRLLADPTAFEIVESGRRARGRSAGMVAVNAPVFAPPTR